MFLLIVLNNKTYKEERVVLSGREYLGWKESNDRTNNYTVLKISKK
jgi:hypothetical protein